MGGVRMKPLYVDVRHAGDHGIARYAREVRSRLSVGWQPFDNGLRSGSPADAVSLKRLALPRDSILYNPGFEAGPARCAQLLTVHDLTHLQMDEGHHRLKRGYYERLVKPAITKAGNVLTVSETSADDIRCWLADDRIIVTVTGNGCSDAFTEAGAAFVADRAYVLYVGNFKWHKNPRPLFQAIRQLPDLDLRVVTSDQESAVRLAAESGILERVHVHLGITDEKLAELYRGSVVLAFPSRWEGFGLPALEALRCGTKVVYFEGATSVSEVCSGSQFPFADADSHEAIADQIAEAAKSTFRRPANLDRHDWDLVAERVNRTILDRTQS
jgi:glycosyltransferase involved in cell wall biosynthesis